MMELASTLPVLKKENGVLGFNFDELSAYHMLHYGANRLLVEEVGRSLKEEKYAAVLPLGSIKNRVKKLEEILIAALEIGELQSPMTLGRLAIREGFALPAKMKEFTEETRIYPHATSSAVRYERFLYPSSQTRISMSYMGIVPTWNEADVNRVAEAHPPLQDYVSKMPYAEIDFHEIRIRRGDERNSFLTVSSFEQIDSIENQMGGIAAFTPEDFQDLYQHYED